MPRDAILLTPGPLTTTERTKQAMLRDWGSWDSSFIAVTAELRRQLLAIVHGDGHARRACRCRAAAPSRSRRRWRRSCRATGHVLVLDNGAYCKRIGQALDADGPQDDDPAACRGLAGLAAGARGGVAARRQHHATSASSTARPAPGSLNPLQAIADVCARHGKGLIVDAMSSFAALADRRPRARVRRAGRGQRQVPRRRARDGLRLHQEGRDRRRCRQLAFAGDGPARPARLHGEDRPVALHAADARGRGPAPRRCASSRRRAASRPRLARYTAQLRGAGRRHEGARLRAFPRPGGPGADHRHLPCAGRSGATTSSRSTTPSRRTASSSIRASSPQRRDLSRRLHRRDRPGRDEGSGRRCRRRA